MFTDASEVGIGGCLFQIQDEGNLCPIAFFSRRLSPTQRRWDTREREAYAIKFGLQRYKEMIEGHKIYIFTDQSSLQWAESAPQSKIQRWVWYMQQFDAEVYYIRGNFNMIADWLSRTPPDDEGEKDEMIDGISVPLPVHVQVSTEMPMIRPPTLTELSESYGDAPAEDFRNLVKGDDRLWYHHKTGKLYIPPKFREPFLYWIHAGKHGSHRGIKATLKTLQRYVFWPRLQESVSDYISSCLLCSRMRIPNRAHPRAVLQRPCAFDLVSLDYVGPRDARGVSWYYLVLIDHATRYVVTSATTEPVTAHVIKTLKECWIRYFGTPNVILTDNGAQFTSYTFMTFVRTELYCTLAHTSPYNPEGNALNEAVHQSLDRGVVSRLSQPNILHFSEVLDKATHAYNAAWQSALRTSPFHALFGKDINLPGLQLLQPLVREGERRYVQRLRTYIQEVEQNLPTFPAEEKRASPANVVVGDHCIFERPEADQRRFNPDGHSAHAYGLKWSLPAKVIEVDRERSKVKEYATHLERYVPFSKVLMLPKFVPTTLRPINWKHIKMTMPPTWKEPLDSECLPEAYRHYSPPLKQRGDSAPEPYLGEAGESTAVATPQGSIPTSPRRGTKKRKRDEMPAEIIHQPILPVNLSDSSSSMESSDEEEVYYSIIKEEDDLPFELSAYLGSI